MSCEFILLSFMYVERIICVDVEHFLLSFVKAGATGI